ncbi:MAG: hypothetical protein PVJ49_00165 [Acidobacteriota bacterium]|jgi:hypothetical protein
MLDRHEADKQFVDNLEWQIGAEVRRRNRNAGSGHPPWRVVRVAAVVVVSMALGAAAMGASYQIEESWRRELAQADLEVRLQLARKRLELIEQEAAAIERRAAVGSASVEEQAQMRMAVADSEGQLRLLELQLEEVLASGREPVGEVSSPVIRGRDFVTERLEVELQIAQQMFELVQGEVDRERTRFEIGTGGRAQLEVVQLALADREQRVRSLQRRLEIRDDFVGRRISGVEAELMVRIADTEGELEVARRRFELTQRELDTVRERVRLGIETPITANQYELALAEAEAQLRLAEVELEVLRQELERQQR